MKKILTSALALGAMTLIIGCGGEDRLVEKLKKTNQTILLEKGFEIIKAKNNNAIMDFSSLKTLKNFY
ncbi:hypothetical protein UXU46_02560 [Campylobacter jejuni]